MSTHYLSEAKQATLHTDLHPLSKVIDKPPRVEEIKDAADRDNVESSSRHVSEANLVRMFVSVLLDDRVPQLEDVDLESKNSDRDREFDDAEISDGIRGNCGENFARSAGNWSVRGHECSTK